MAAKHQFAFWMIAKFFRDNNRQIQRGEVAYRDSHVITAVFDGSIQPMMLKGVVQASMKNRNYNVEISIDNEDGLVAASCTCPRGGVVCHHMAALCFHGHYNVSSTDVQCSWASSKPVTSDTMRLTDMVSKRLEVAPYIVYNYPDMYPITNSEYRATNRAVTEAEVTDFQNNLKGTTVGFLWYLKPEVEDTFSFILDIDEILLSGKFNEAENKVEFLKQKLCLSKDTCEKITLLTIGQADKEHWLVARKNRLTASKFGIVLKAIKKNRFTPSLFKTLVEGYNVGTVKAIQWGRENENIAKEVFIVAKNKDVTPTGLWLDTCGFIGASPDGLVDDDAVLEVKCPYKFRNTSLQVELGRDKKYIIYKDAGHTYINEDHDYWHQIQGHLFITNRSHAYLVVWTPMETEIVVIQKDPAWEQNFTLLQQFYLNQFVQFLSGKYLDPPCK